MIFSRYLPDAERGPSLLGRGPHPLVMARAKTGSFYLTETVVIPAAAAVGTRYQGTIDLGAYISVAQGIAVAVESVDFIHQAGADFGSDVQVMLVANGAVTTQLTDLNPGTAFIRADDHSLIASGSLNINQPNNVASHVSDLYPDNFGPSNLSEAYLVVNDSLYLVSGVDGAAAFTDITVTVRIKCRIVSLSKSDWIAIAIQSTASDN